MMTDVRFYFSPEFLKDFKRENKAHPRFDEDFDIFLESYLRGKISRIECIPGLPKGCQGFKVSKFKKFVCSEMNKGSRCGYRIIFSEYGDCVLFLALYNKKNRIDMDSNKVCESLSTVRDRTCKGSYVLLESQNNSRRLLRG